MSDEAKTFPNLERACGGEIRLARLIQIKATLARQPDAVQAEFLEFMRLSREMFALVDGYATYAYLIILTDEEGDVGWLAGSGADQSDPLGG